jgi:hypothetical protein
VSFTLTEIFNVVRDSIAAHLDIDPEAIDRDFRFHYFVDRMAAARQNISGSKSSSDYVEAAGVYMDLTEYFQVQFFTEYTGRDCLTVGDIVDAIAAKLRSSIP